MVQPTHLKKTANESRKYDFDFTNQAELLDGQTLTGSPTVTVSPSGPTLGSAVLNSAGTKVQVQISGGTAGQSYHVTCLVNTTGGSTLEECGTLRIIEC